MARQISVDVSEGVKELISQVTGFQEGTNNFNRIQKYLHEKLKKSDTMYFLHKTEVDKNIAGMAEKFTFHGFFSQAKALQEAYNGFMSHNASKANLTSQFNIVKFLLCMSDKPTSHFLENPEKFEIKPEPEEEDINWGEYLKEGIENSIPRFDDNSDESEISSIREDTPTLEEEIKVTNEPMLIPICEKDVVMNLRANREELLNTIQHTWYGDLNFHDIPPSERKEANVGIIWENFLEQQAMGLVVMKKSSILSEYKVIKEILWQMWGPHTSSLFCFEGNSLTTRKNVTVSSSRSISFQSFIQKEIMPHIKLLEYFRDFSEFLLIKNEDFVTMVPQTYRSYNSAIQNIIQPIYFKLSELEDTVREQETTYTLVNLAQDLEVILEPVKFLKKIHDLIIIDFWDKDNITCATSLLARLHSSLQHAVNEKIDQDLRVTLYIESIYHYLTLIDSWFMKNDLNDYSGEFLIINNNKTVYQDGVKSGITIRPSEDNYCNLNFRISEKLEEESKNDGVLKIITRTVIQIGRNLHLLRLLGDFSILNENKETMYEEFVRKSLEELCKLFDEDPKILFPEKYDQYSKETQEYEETGYKFPVACTEDCNRPTEMDKLDNLVDTTDGFLMLAFKDYFKCEKTTTKPKNLSLYEKISMITKKCFPVTNFFEDILNNILMERFTVSGLRVKNILIEQYLLEKQFQFLRHIFLFFDNIIFEFYRRFFIKVYANSKNWGNDIWLSSHLQDIIMDLYPDFYDKCSVQIKENWKDCSDPLEACNMLSINIDIQWPLNVIITESQMVIYRDVFHFILKIKWGLYTLNHLSFTDLEPKRKRDKTKSQFHKTTIMKLKYLRFALVNLLNSIHHYIFSFVFTKCFQKFELDFEKSSDLVSIMSSHSEFISEINKMVMEIKDCGKQQSSLDNVNKCIKLLKFMWENIGYATPERLYQNYESYKRSFNAISPIISPVYLFDY